MLASQIDQRRVKEKFFLILASLTLLYFNTFWDLVQVWSSDEDYGHGFAILPISLFIVWKKRETLLNDQIEPAGWGYIVIALWIVFYTVGIVGQISTVTVISMILFLIGAVCVLMGTRTAIDVMFPICFLVFMFPIPTEIYTHLTNPLMLFATSASHHILSALNMPILREGNLLYLPNYSMQVVNACSGIRSLSMIMALALLIGYFAISSNLIRLIFFILSVPIAIFGNILRIAITALLAYHYSPQVAEGFSHTLAGLVTFIVSLILLYGCMEIFSWFSKTRET